VRTLAPLLAVATLLPACGCTPDNPSPKPLVRDGRPRDGGGRPRPTLVGRWQAVQGALAWGYEVIQFHPGGTLTLTAPGQPFAVQGRYAEPGATFSCTLDMPQGARTVTLPVLALDEGRLVLRSRGIGVPPPPDLVYWRADANDGLRKRLAGVWQGGPDHNQETLAFTADGVMESAAPGGLRRTAYRIAGNDIELARVGPGNALRVIRLGLVSLTDADLVLEINNRRVAYKRRR
jgi:hypothetical protein